MSSESERALNEFLGENDWDDLEINLDRWDELQQYNETSWSKDGFIGIDASFTEKTGEEIPKVGRFYDHTEGEFIWGQNVAYSFCTDDKTGYPVGIRLYEKDAETKIDLAKQLIEEAEDAAKAPSETYLFDSWYCAREPIESIELYDKDWISALKSDRPVEYACEQRRTDEIHEMVDLVEREIDDELYKIWTKKLAVSQLGRKKVIIAEKVEDGDNPVKYLVTNRIDAHNIRSYGYRWRIETFFEDSK